MTPYVNLLGLSKIVIHSFCLRWNPIKTEVPVKRFLQYFNGTKVPSINTPYSDFFWGLTRRTPIWKLYKTIQVLKSDYMLPATIWTSSHKNNFKMKNELGNQFCERRLKQHEKESQQRPEIMPMLLKPTFATLQINYGKGFDFVPCWVVLWQIPFLQYYFDLHMLYSDLVAYSGYIKTRFMFFLKNSSSVELFYIYIWFGRLKKKII